ncbi:MAG: hypothetical protein M3R49_00960 [Chloroflexota bacterium]|nr:hypothetical protein [Chloroflexota bacterium]
MMAVGTISLSREFVRALRPALVVALVMVNCILVVGALRDIPRLETIDWDTFATLPERLASGTLYDLDDYWRWSPVAAWLLVPLASLGGLGYAALVAAHVAILPTLGYRMLPVLLSWPFVVDALEGNLFTFVVVLGVLAFSGSRWATYGFFSAFLLMPRPIMLAALLWLLARDRRNIAAFAILLAVHTALVALSGYGSQWIATLSRSGGDIANLGNVSPSHWIGPVWLVIGIPLGAWLLSRGHVGPASLAITPYVLPQYLLALLWAPRPPRSARIREESWPTSACR